MQQKQYSLTQLDSDILAICPIEADKNSLYILTIQGHLYCYQITEQQLQPVCAEAITLPTLNNRELRHYGTPVYDMKCSDNGKFIAIFVDYGQFGIVIDTKTQNVVLEIDTQNYYEDTVPFSLAFSTFEYDDIVIYRSDWNKLDTFNLTQQSSPTERTIAPYEDERPEHYLDYFHGALYVSPNGENILDDGWVWQPVAVPSAWSIRTWLTKNPFESEDGASLVQPCYRDNWDYPMCWINNETVALWHIELWDEDEFDLKPIPENKLGVHLIKPLSENMWDNDYVPRYWEMPEQSQKILNLYADQGKLIVIGNENISIYDITNQTFIAQITNTSPNKQHLKRHSLWAFQKNILIETPYSNLQLADV